MLAPGSAISTPVQPRRTRPYRLRSIATFIARSMGMANPRPTLPPDSERMKELTPTTSPTAFTRGPPELPGLMAASVWIMSTYRPAWPAEGRTERRTALTTPAVTDGSLLPSRKP